MKSNRFVIIGVGNVGRDLLGKLSKEYEVLCIDTAPDAEEKARKIRKDARVLQADATSRLVLEEADVDDASAVLITTTTEKVNIEVASVLRNNFQPRRIISVGITTQGIKRLEELGVEVVNIFVTTASTFQYMLEQKTKAAHSIGLDKNEILEVEVHPNSRLANKRLGALAPIRWRIGIIYREGHIIVPHRDTVLKPKDRVVILGDPATLKTVSEILTFNFEKFPLEYGAKVMVYLSGTEGEDFFGEVEYLFSAFPLQKAIFLYSAAARARGSELADFIRSDRLEQFEEKSSDLAVFNAIESVMKENGGDYGFIVLSREAVDRLMLPAGKKRFLQRLSSLAACPILLASGSAPYEKIATPCVEESLSQHALETALEISSSLNYEVSALLVQPSKYIASDEDTTEFSTIKKNISEMSLMYRVNVKTPILQGNPIKAVLKVLQEYNLLVVDTGEWKKQQWFSALLDPDVVWHIVKGARISTLILPPVEESL